jgi:hypothetical protein
MHTGVVFFSVIFLLENVALCFFLMEGAKTGAQRNREYKERRGKIATYTVEVPTTPGLTRKPKPHVLIDADAFVYDTQKRVIIRVWKDKAQNQVKELDRSTHALESEIEIPEHKTTRGMERTIQVGSWRKYAAEMKVTECTDLEPVQIWLGRNKRLFSNCSYLFKCLCRDTHLQAVQKSRSTAQNRSLDHLRDQLQLGHDKIP